MADIISKSSKYGIQSVLYLANKAKSGAATQLRVISNDLGIPHHFLGKILQILVKDEIIRSQKGSKGGFTLGRPASRITLMEIVEAIDGTSFLDHCVLGFSKCDELQPCPAHADWKRPKSLILDGLLKKTIDDLGDDFSRKLQSMGDNNDWTVSRTQADRRGSALSSPNN